MMADDPTTSVTLTAYEIELLIDALGALEDLNTGRPAPIWLWQASLSDIANRLKALKRKLENELPRSEDR